MEWVAIINALLRLAFDLYEKVRQLQGDEEIPDWDEIASKNAILQARIDAQMAKRNET